jgi:hypothetical protein
MTGRPLRASTVLWFWFPLAATWLMMALEGPYIAAIVARMPAAAVSLAAYGVAVSLAWLIESPIMMLLSAATALVRDRESYLALRRFMNILNGLVTAGMIVLAIPPVFRWVGETLIGLPREISELAHLSTIIMIPWPAAIGYRRFYQGILVRHHLTRRVAYGTVLRLFTMTVSAALLAWQFDFPGAVIGAVALLTGVVFEAVASRWMARHVVRGLMESEPAEGTLLRFADIAAFYFPLALTSILSMALGPLVTFGLGRSRAPLESLAVWPVLNSLAFMFRSGGVAFQEVGIALPPVRVVRQTAFWLAVSSTAAMAVVAFTSLQSVWFQTISGLTPDLAAHTVWPVRVLALLPALEYLLSVQRAQWIVAHRTRVITVATAVEAAGLAVALFFAIVSVNLVGALAGAVALVVGRLAANGYLFWRAQRV